MLSIVNHRRWEDILRSLFNIVCRAIPDKENAAAATAALATMKGEEGKMKKKEEETKDEKGERKNENQEDDDGEEEEEEEEEDDKDVEEHTRLCRGTLGTAMGAMLAVLEPDAARGKVLEMDDGKFHRRMFEEMTKILPARHGDASLDAVGVIHRLLWIRPDAGMEEREMLISGLIAIGDEDVGPNEDGSGGGDDELDFDFDFDDDDDEDPDDDWTLDEGYMFYDGGERRTTTPATAATAAATTTTNDVSDGVDDEAAAALAASESDAEQVTMNGLMAALRTHLPSPGRAGEGKGAGGGSVACTQALHIFRALFEDLNILDIKTRADFRRVRGRQRLRAARRSGGGKEVGGSGGGGGGGGGGWRQLQTRQLRDLVGFGFGSRAFPSSLLFLFYSFFLLFNLRIA